MLKRAMDVLLGGVLLVCLAPLCLLIACFVRALDGRPLLFIQERVGLAGRPFKMLKFRTMLQHPGAERGSFDAGGSSRVTALGRFLRRTKLDEVPQLWNVLAGDMSLVGPRPEVRRWVDAYPKRWDRILTVRPGITDPASIEFRNEEAVLASASDPDVTYRDVVLPKKLDLYERYIAKQSLWRDVWILLRTLWVVGRG